MKLPEKKILIHHENSIRDLQVTFNTVYPFLKIDFLGTNTLSKSLTSCVIDPATPITQLAAADARRKINISSYRTVAEVLHDFEHMLGVLGEISRKSGNVWNKISITEEWTLESQNAAGEFISSEMTKP